MNISINHLFYVGYISSYQYKTGMTDCKVKIKAYRENLFTVKLKNQTVCAGIHGHPMQVKVPFGHHAISMTMANRQRNEKS
jgi:hypothetical protein